MKSLTANSLKTLAVKVMLPVSLILAVSFLSPVFSVKYKSAGGWAQVDGDSTMHKWNMKGSQINGSVEIKTGTGTIADIKPGNLIANLSIPVKSLKSGKDGLDDNGYKAMKVDKNPNINFVLSDIEIKKVEGNKATIIAKGTLTMAGTAKVVSFWGSITVNADKSLKITASYGTLLTSFSIEPPTAMMGMVKTKDNVTLNVVWNVKPPDRKSVV